MVKIFTFLFFVLALQVSYAQNVGINSSGAAPHASAGLDVSFTDKGFLAPRLTLAQKLAILSPATGLLVYQTDGVAGFYYYNGTTWAYNGSSSQWTTSGSDIYYLNKVGIGTSSALTYPLTVNAASNPLFLSGVQEGSGLDSILLIVNGVVKKRVYTATASTNAWSLTGNSGQTAAAYNTGSYIGNSDSNPLRFRTNNTQRMHIHATNGGVAIGTNPSFNATNPEKLLVDIGGTSGTPAATTAFNAINAKGYINSYLQLNVQNQYAGTSASSDVVATANDGSESNYYVDMGINSSANTANYFGGAHDAYLYNLGEDLLIGTGTSGKNLKFLTGGTSETNNTRMMLHGTGNLGIGSTTNTDDTDDAKVEIVANEDQYTGLGLYGDSDNYFELNVQNEANELDSSSDIVATANNGTEISNYINMGINSQNYRTNGGGTGRILNGPNKTYLYGAGAEMYIGNAAADEPLIFFTNSGSEPDEDARGSERMRITDDGKVLIGYTTDQSTWLNDYKLQVNGDLLIDDLFYDQATQTSDRRLKTNISGLTYGLKDVLKLRPVTYNWKKTPDTNKQVGLIAQEVREVIPEIVKGDESKETIGMDYISLVPVLINAIKEQQKQIEELKKSDAENKVLIDKLLQKQ